MHEEDKIYFLTDFFEAINLNAEEGQEIKASDLPKKVKIPVTRSGEFAHPWYGDLDFSQDYLQGIVDNFNNKVYPQKIAGNLNHRSGDEAFAWIENEKALSIEPVTFQTSMGPQTRDFLFAEVELTEDGQEMLRKKKYRYISAEIHPDYTTREVYSVGDGKAVVRHGPTLVGFAFTNKPFIPDLMSVFNEAGEKIGEKEVETVLLSEKDIVGSFTSVRSIKDSTEKAPEVVEPPVQQGQTKGVGMNFSELMASLEGKTAEARVAVLKDAVKNFSEGDNAAIVAYMYSSAKQELERDSQLNEAREQARNFSELAGRLEALVKTQSISNFSMKVENVVSKFSDRGYSEDAIQGLREYALSFKGIEEIKLSDTEYVSPLDIFEKVLDLTPEASQVDFSDLTQVDPEGNPADPVSAAVVDEPAVDEAPEKVKLFASKHNYKVEDVDESMYSLINDQGLMEDPEGGNL